MPAYFSLDVLFSQDILYDAFIVDVHNAIEKAGFHFVSGYWNAKDLSLNEILKINQKLLSEKFILLPNQNFEEDYKQVIYSNGDLKIRLFWMILDDEILLSIIVPEYDMLMRGDQFDSKFVFQTIPLKLMIDLAETIWELNYSNSIQACLELDDLVSKVQMLEGEKPCCNPFLILRDSLFEVITIDMSNLLIKKADKNSVFILNETKLINDFV